MNLDNNQPSRLKTETRVLPQLADRKVNKGNIRTDFAFLKKKSDSRLLQEAMNSTDYTMQTEMAEEFQLNGLEFVVSPLFT